MSKMSELYPQYFKDVTDLTEADVYRICDLFEVGKRDPSGATHHAIKKLLLPGVRTGGKSVEDDVKEARNTLTRRLDMWAEDRANADKRRKEINDSFGRMGEAVHGIDYKLDLEKFGQTTDEMLKGLAKSVAQSAIGKLIIAHTKNGIPYHGGFAAVEKGSALPVDVIVDGTGAWARVQADDTILTFCQRHGIRPYELRELNNYLADRSMYDGIGAAVYLRIK